MTSYEEELNNLLEQTKTIKSPINAAPIGTNIDEYNHQSEVWINDVEIFYNKYLKDHIFADRIRSILFAHKLGTNNASSYNELVGYLESISHDTEFTEKMNGIQVSNITQSSVNKQSEFDVFISHASKDKADIVEELYQSLEKLGVLIFYDSKSLEWGDKWKDRILNGTQKAEFAIIVISENFFDREWTEKELQEFLNRQNSSGQMIILPILHNITVEQLQEKYPNVADIQAIDSREYNCDQIAVLFARQLIKRLKNI